MRGLSELELRGLRDLLGPEELVDEDDPREQAWNVCVERGLASYQESAELRQWDITDLGRLALRVHYAVTQGA